MPYNRFRDRARGVPVRLKIPLWPRMAPSYTPAPSHFSLSTRPLTGPEHYGHLYKEQDRPPCFAGSAAVGGRRHLHPLWHERRRPWGCWRVRCCTPDLRGVHSNGVLRVPDYVGKLTRDGVDP